MPFRSASSPNSQTSHFDVETAVELLACRLCLARLSLPSLCLPAHALSLLSPSLSCPLPLSLGFDRRERLDHNLHPRPLLRLLAHQLRRQLQQRFVLASSLAWRQLQRSIGSKGQQHLHAWPPSEQGATAHDFEHEHPELEHVVLPPRPQRLHLPRPLPQRQQMSSVLGGRDGCRPGPDPDPWGPDGPGVSHELSHLLPLQRARVQVCKLPRPSSSPHAQHVAMLHVSVAEPRSMQLAQAERDIQQHFGCR
eukprot:763683-Hanusia_phi.AAC.1